MKNHTPLPRNHCRVSGFFWVCGRRVQAWLSAGISWKDTLLFTLFCASLQPFAAQLLLPTQPVHWYQLFTGHWVHLGWLHWGLNMAVLMCLPFIMPYVPKKHFWGLALLMPVCLSYLLVWHGQLAQAQVVSYAGFSGVLHGIYVFFALYFVAHGFFGGWLGELQNASISKLPSLLHWQSACIFVGIVVKVIYEQYAQPTHTANMLGAKVLYAAHADGVIFGVCWFVLVCVLWWLKRHYFTQSP